MAAAFRGDDVGGNIDRWVAELRERAELAMQEVVTALEGWAKSEHGHPGALVRGPASSGSGPRRRVVNGVPQNDPHDPPYWDETGDTTRSIKGEVVEVSAELVRGVLSAGMDYDIYLELAREGKWAFLWPTIVAHKDDIEKIIAARMAIGSTSSVASVSETLETDYEQAKADARNRRWRMNAEGAD